MGRIVWRERRFRVAMFVDGQEGEDEDDGLVTSRPFTFDAHALQFLKLTFWRANLAVAPSNGPLKTAPSVLWGSLSGSVGA